jgi:23S rRNA pseudouridine1911/1915/1917 synthase
MSDERGRTPGPDTATEITITLPADTRPERLDRALARLLPELSRSRLKALIESGQVTRAGAPDDVVREPSTKVGAGQTFAIILPNPRPALPQAQAIDLVVLYEDQDLIVIDKPAGLVVHPAPGNQDLTLVNALLAHCGESLTGIGGVLRPGIVHRLDKDTSGILVAAKSARAHAGLTQQFARRSVTRSYLAAAWGAPNPAAGEISGAIGRSPVNRKKMAVVARGGKAALTRYRTLRRYAGGAASLLECRLATGRTHQIRVHLAHIGHALLGDPLYGRPRAAAPRVAAAAARLGRQALHANALGFVHPASGAPLSFTSEPPRDLQDLLDSLESLQTDTIPDR